MGPAIQAGINAREAANSSKSVDESNPYDGLKVLFCFSGTQPGKSANRSFASTKGQRFSPVPGRLRVDLRLGSMREVFGIR